MIRIGPSGNSVTFYETGRKTTAEAPAWLHEIGLNAFEYSFGRGVNLSDATAMKIGEQMRKYDIALSGHAPYYINFANAEEEMIQKSFEYVHRSLKAVLLMGGNRVIFHPAAQGRQSRADAFAQTKLNIARLVDYLKENIPSEHSYILCPETMGKLQQIGTVEEVVEICKLDDMLYPCYDFGHINSYTQGGLTGTDSYKKIIEYTFEQLGEKKTKNMHIHFSKIQYGSSGEIRHLTLADQKYGPEYGPLAKVIDEFDMTPVIICESKDIMSDDALLMKKYHKSFN